MSDIKYAWYTSSVGFRTTTGTSSQFLKADGSVDNSTYVLANGTNATGAWSNSSNGLENNPTLPGKTMTGAVTTSLQDANNGTIAGYLNSVGTAAGNPDANWWFRIKMLHPNSIGYNGEIAVQMTGGNSLRYRKTEAGHYGGWIETVDQSNVIIVGGKKMFYTYGNNYTDMALEAYSDTAAYPAIAFNKAGQFAGSIAMVNSGLYQFRDLAGTGLVNTQVSISHATNGFVHNGYNDPNKALVSDGSVADLDVDVINSGGTLRVQDYFERFDVNYTFNGIANPHKLVHLVSRQDIYLEDLQPGQRIVMINEDGAVKISIYVDGNWVFQLIYKQKVTFYVENNLYIHIYDVSDYMYYTP